MDDNRKKGEETEGNLHIPDVMPSLPLVRCAPVKVNAARLSASVYLIYNALTGY